MCESSKENLLILFTQWFQEGSGNFSLLLGFPVHISIWLTHDPQLATGGCSYGMVLGHHTPCMQHLRYVNILRRFVVQHEMIKFLKKIGVSRLIIHSFLKSSSDLRWPCFVEKACKHLSSIMSMPFYWCFIMSCNMVNKSCRANSYRRRPGALYHLRKIATVNGGDRLATFFLVPSFFLAKDQNFRIFWQSSVRRDEHNIWTPLYR